MSLTTTPRSNGFNHFTIVMTVVFGLALIAGIVLLATAKQCSPDESASAEECKRRESRRIAGILLTIIGTVVLAIVGFVWYFYKIGASSKFVGQNVATGET